MLNNKRQNYHHSKLPNLGDIVTLPDIARNDYRLKGKWVVESFNLCDNTFPYSVGIHLVNLASLRDRRARITVSGFWCEAL